MLTSFPQFERSIAFFVQLPQPTLPKQPLRLINLAFSELGESQPEEIAPCLALHAGRRRDAGMLAEVRRT